MKKLCLVLSLFASSAMHASFSSLGSYFKGLFSRPSHDQVPNDAMTSTTTIDSNYNNKTKYLFGFGVGFSALAGYVGYWWHKKSKTDWTNNLAEAISDKSEKGTRYWLARTNESNINESSSIDWWTCGWRSTPLEQALVNRRNDLALQLLQMKADPNKMDG